MSGQSRQAIGIFTLLAVTAFSPLRAETEALDVEGIFELQGSFSKRWGIVNTAKTPWVYSYSGGWIFVDAASTPDGYWIWIEKLGWIYSSASTFPQAYRQDTSEWILIDLTDPVRYKYYSFGSRTWHQIRKPGFEDWLHYKQVPVELQGLASYRSDPIAMSGSSLEIGPYFIAFESFSRVTSDIRTFFYNPEDGWFYPLEAYSYVFPRTLPYGTPVGKESACDEREICCLPNGMTLSLERACQKK
jgi:hypothetical protein